MLGGKPSIADVALYARLAPVVSSWSSEQRTGGQGFHHIVRHVDFVQSSPMFGLQVSDGDKVKVNVDDVLTKIKAVDPKAEKERKKKEKEALAAAGATSAAAAGATVTSAAGPEAQNKAQNKAAASEGDKPSLGEKIAAAVGAEVPGVSKKKEKKEKQPKQPKQPAVPEKPLSPSLIDLRVGHILKAINHPNADSLYVSTIACGDAPGTDNTSEYEGQVCRTVCSGLNGLVPLEEMQGRKIVAVCNLKPVTMRGIKSAAMVLAASPRPKEGEDDYHGGPVELVSLPEGATAGERVYFEGWEEGAPEAVLNPKKKVWETIQPGFTTTDALEVGFDASAVDQLKSAGSDKGVGRLRTKGGFCTVKTLTGATVR